MSRSILSACLLLCFPIISFGNLSPAICQYEGNYQVNVPEYTYSYKYKTAQQHMNAIIEKLEEQGFTGLEFAWVDGIQTVKFNAATKHNACGFFSENKNPFEDSIDEQHNKCRIISATLLAEKVSAENIVNAHFVRHCPVKNEQ